MEKFYIFVGNFGSGKSEIAINMALSLAKEGQKVTLADMDIINPYFRSGERGDVLGAAGVRLIAPPYALHKIEITSISPEVYRLFHEEEGIAVIDAGGDPVGARALGQYKQNFDAVAPGAVETFMVVNPFRPLVDTTQKAIEIMENIVFTSRQQITGLINNANLAGETGPLDILEGYNAVKELSQETNIPVFATSGTRDALSGFLALAEEKGLDSRYIGRPIYLNIEMHRSWDKYINEGL